ncbi:hypothetical protein HAX54_012078 [Datura stramonium]|uniref:Uncharacterized protein n=1 Tax=Datura stramonium TaxID=4076 RepID=A0ABS8TM38_DATST|nr:hypothetical protein [Datura stramonium]
MKSSSGVEQEACSGACWLEPDRGADVLSNELLRVLQVKVSHWLWNGLMVCLYGLGQSSPHELAFGVELDPGVISVVLGVKHEHCLVPTLAAPVLTRSSSGMWEETSSRSAGNLLANISYDDRTIYLLLHAKCLLKIRIICILSFLIVSSSSWWMNCAMK